MNISSFYISFYERAAISVGMPPAIPPITLTGSQTQAFSCLFGRLVAQKTRKPAEPFFLL
jgi:hypothetical protein